MKAFNKTILKFLYLAYYENNDKFELNRAITDFLLYSNGKKHTTTKYSLYEVMEKIFQETFLTKVKYNTIKSRKNHKIEKYQINQKDRISSFIIQPLKEKNYLNFKEPDIVSKSQAIEDWKVKANIIQKMRNNVKVKIISLQPRHHLLQKDSIWSINKDAIK